MTWLAEIWARIWADRFSRMLLWSGLGHMIVLLGLGFSLPDNKLKNTLPTLDVTVVHNKSESKPDEADFLANQTQEGGGESDRKNRTTTPLPTTEPVPAPQPRLAEAPPPVPEPPKKKPKERILTAKSAPRKLPRPETEQPLMETPPMIQPDRFSLRQIQQQRTELAAALDREMDEYQKRPKPKFITARTREYKYAAYMDAWRIKVERIGNLNYPQEAKRQGLTGALMLDVAINKDGTLNNIRIVRSSNKSVLDQAAVAIVKMSAPFAPLPANIREEADILHIVRTWQFRSGGRLVSQ